MSYAFQAEGPIKSFGKTTALAGTGPAAGPGTVRGLLGPNGAQEDHRCPGAGHAAAA
jgi:oleandomycin transport system ATP-binding protein